MKPFPHRSGCVCIKAKAAAAAVGTSLRKRKKEERNRRSGKMNGWELRTRTQQEETCSNRK